MEMTLEDFETMLKNHDWTYEYSDDMRYWTKGKESEKQIKIAVQLNPLLQQFYKDYIIAKNNGTTKPTASDYI